MHQEEREKLEKIVHQLYNAYLYLRDHDLSAESNTSHLLQEHNPGYLVTRLADELQELADLQAAGQVHEEPSHDTILEASQVGYWLMLLAVTRNIRFDDFKPQEALLRGFDEATSTTPEQTQECLNLLQGYDSLHVTQGLALGFKILGQLCAEARISLLAPLEFDLEQMRRKGLVQEP